MLMVSCRLGRRFVIFTKRLTRYSISFRPDDDLITVSAHRFKSRSRFWHYLLFYPYDLYRCLNVMLTRTNYINSWWFVFVRCLFQRHLQEITALHTQALFKMTNLRPCLQPTDNIWNKDNKSPVTKIPSSTGTPVVNYIIFKFFLKSASVFISIFV